MASPEAKKARRSSNPTLPDFDWKLCVLCQSKSTGPSTGPLRCPGLNPISNTVDQGYITLERNLLGFKALNALPSSVRISQLDDGSGIAKTLSAHRAKFHVACMNKFKTTELRRLQLRRDKENLRLSESSPSPLRQVQERVTRSTPSPLSSKVKTAEKCIICGKPSTRKELLRMVQTAEREAELLEFSKRTRDGKMKGVLEAQIFAGDFRARRAMYHNSCWLTLRNSCREHVTPVENTNQQVCEGLAFADLHTYIFTSLGRPDARYHRFKMSDLTRMYMQKLAELEGTSMENMTHVHTTRLRERIIAQFPELVEEKIGREYHLISQAALQTLVKSVDRDEDAIAFRRVVLSLRDEMAAATSEFTGEFTPDCQEKSIPSALLAVISSILYGPSAVGVSRASQPVLAACQILMYNYHLSAPRRESHRNLTEREPPLPLYLGLTALGDWASKKAVEELHSCGLSVSYTRVREVTSSLSQLAVARAEEEGLVCPANLRRGVPTIVGYDNIDQNKRTSTMDGSTHGTSMSVQQVLTENRQGTVRSFTVKYADMDHTSRKVPSLPDTYRAPPGIILPTTKPTPTHLHRPPVQAMATPSNLWHQEEPWLDYVRACYLRPLAGKLDFTWAGFHATNAPRRKIIPALNGILPTFSELSTDPSMMCHGMNLAIKLTDHLNPGQTAVMTGTLRLIGDLLEGSGWAGVLAASGFVSETAAKAILQVQHLKRARRAHEVTVAVLYILLLQAYDEDNDNEAFEKWVQSRADASPTFYFWLLVLNLETLYFLSLKAVRGQNFELYKESLARLLPWFFAVDRLNYAKALCIHLTDLTYLDQVAPTVHQMFSDGFFALNKTAAPHSAIAADQFHEQNNAVIKVEMGASGLIHDETKLDRKMLAGPEIARLRHEFSRRNTKQKADSTRHHEQTPAHQRKFQEAIWKVKEAFEDIGNPFLETTERLICLDSGAVMPPECVSNLRKANEEGINMVHTFCRDRLSTGGANKNVFDRMQKCNLDIFRKVTAAPKPAAQQIKGLRSDLHLLSTLYMAAKSRKVNDNHAFPPSLTKNCEMFSGTKSDILEILENELEVSCPPNTIDGIVYDGAALVHLKRPKRSKTFKQYWADELLPHIVGEVQEVSARRADLVFDTYNEMSIKDGTRRKRGTSAPRRVQASNTLPSNFQEFMKNSQNKTELFRFLAYSALASPGLHCVVNMGDTMMASTDVPSHLAGVSCALQDEADGRLFLHVLDMVQHGAKTVKVRTVDSDVVVLAVSFFWQLQEAGLSELWVDFGGVRRRYIAAHKIALKLGNEKATALRGFHAFTGCDTVSAFVGKGKKSCWSNWAATPLTTAAFLEISSPVSSLSAASLHLFALFSVRLYKGDVTMSLEENRKLLFPKRKGNAANLPPTMDSLKQHIFRAVFQAGFIWGQALLTLPTMPSPSKWGWHMEEGKWAPTWTTQPPIWEECPEMRGCSCKTACGYQCGCRKAKLTCFPLCQNCQGMACTNKMPISGQSAVAQAAGHPESDEEDVDDPEALSTDSDS
ncbi:Chromosome-associated kinesin KIF4 [Frankliniella fusca]|uniref:Chromosome-associated kinesin KIF4 n=1 Tax=Frankliniella fusca TaxID=407009 RepID=A0AAE1GWL7_9NEOP|nr:Chromosome-associated kinesin KIF4 [Frankliniella fusca]